MSASLYEYYMSSLNMVGGYILQYRCGIVQYQAQASDRDLVEVSLVKYPY